MVRDLHQYSEISYTNIFIPYILIPKYSRQFVQIICVDNWYITSTSTTSWHRNAGIKMTSEHTAGPDRPPRPLLLVDGSNVAYGSGSDTPRLERLKNVIEELKIHKLRTVVITDANLRHFIDARTEFEEMVRVGTIVQAPAATSADDFLLQMALKVQARGEEVFILTNDTFPVRRAQGIIRRIAFMTVPLGDNEEYIFIPTLETLYEPEPKEPKGTAPALPPAKAGPPPIKESLAIDRVLMDVFLNFLTTLTPPIVEGQEIPFTNIAGYLHNQFEGDFCRRFGYSRPKDFATALKSAGLVEFRFIGAPLYLKMTKKVLEETAQLDAEDELPEKPDPLTPAPVIPELKLLESIMAVLKKEMHYPTDFRISIKLNGLAPNRPYSTDSFIEKGLKKGLIERQKMDRWTCYWPTGGQWEAIDPDDPANPYPVELWNDFKESIHRIPNHNKSNQSRYHLAKHLGASGIPSMESLPLAKREHMVQLAANLKLLEFVQTHWGSRFSVPLGD